MDPSLSVEPYTTQLGDEDSVFCDFDVSKFSCQRMRGGFKMFKKQRNEWAESDCSRSKTVQTQLQLHCMFLILMQCMHDVQNQIYHITDRPYCSQFIAKNLVESDIALLVWTEMSKQYQFQQHASTI